MALSKIQGIEGQVTPNLGRRNLIINGAMNIAQRATSVTGLGNGGGYYTLDRHRFSSGNTAGRLTQSQASITDLPGFANAMKLDCTTADTSIAANEDCSLQYRLEGQDLQQLKKGTSSAESVTVSFYMKTNKAFTFMCELDDTDNNRFNGQQFTTSTSWTRHTLTFVGDTTGTLDDNNERSMMLNFWLHAGSNFTSGTYTANTWQSRAATDTNRAVGIGSFYDNTANELHLTGLQMEVGATATDFEHRSYGEELSLCQRYYEQVGSGAPALANSSTQFWTGYQLKTEKRAEPTASVIASTVRYFKFGIANRDNSSPSVGQAYYSPRSANIRVDNFSSLSANESAITGGSTTNHRDVMFAFDAEL